MTTAFSDHCDTLNDLIRQVEGVFAARFSVHVSVLVADDLLHYGKWDGEWRFTLERSDQTTPLTSSALVHRQAAIDHLDALWAACQDEQDLVLRQLRESHQKLRNFLAAHKEPNG